MSNDPVPHGAALEQLWGEADWLHRCARELGYGDHAAEDAVQETLLLAAQEDAGTLGRGWLRLALSRRLGMARRAEKRRALREQIHARPEAVEEDPASAMERLELGRELAQAVEGLPRRDREVLALRFAAGLSPKQIASTLGESPNAVSSRISRALARVRGRLEREDSADRGLSGLLLVLPDLARRGWYASQGACEAALPRAAHVTSHSLLVAGTLMKKHAAASLALIAVATVSAWTWIDPLTNDRSKLAPISLAAEDLAAISPPAEEEPEAASEDTEGTERAAIVPVEARATKASSRPTFEEAESLGRVRVLVTEALSGSPAVGVGCRSVRFHSGAFWNQSRSAITDASGVAVLTDLPAGEHYIYLGRMTADDSAGTLAVQVIAGEVVDLRFQVDAHAVTRGRVIDENGQGVPGAKVWAGDSRFSSTEGYIAGTSGPDGRFTLKYMHPTQFVAAFKAGYAPSLSGAAAIGREEGSDVVLTLTRQLGGVQGTVVNSEGAPVIGARVVIGGTIRPFASDGAGPNPNWSTPMQAQRTDELGQFRFDELRLGEVRVEVRSGTSGLWSETVAITDGGSAELYVELTGGGYLEGTVTQPDGTPAAGARISDLTGEGKTLGRIEMITDADGRYRLEHLTPGNTEFLLESDDMTSKSVHTLEIVDGETTTWNPTLAAPMVFAGVVRSESGAPLAGWNVTSTPLTDGVPGGASMGSYTRTDGSFSFSPDAGELFQFEVFPPGRYWGTAALLLPEIEPSGEQLALTIPDGSVPTGTVLGRVVNAGGDGVQANVEVEFDVSPATKLKTVTSSDGAFEFGYLPHEDFVLRYSVPGGEIQEWTGGGPLTAGERRDVGALSVPE